MCVVLFISVVVASKSISIFVASSFGRVASYRVCVIVVNVSVCLLLCDVVV